MYRPNFYIHTSDRVGTHFEKEDVLNPIKTFLDRHSIPSEIVKDVRFRRNDIYVDLKEGSVDKYGKNIESAFKPLKTASYSCALMKNDLIYCWVPFLEDVIEANNIHQAQSRPSK